MDKAIILSAGQGSRLGHLTDDKPKCLIDFGGRTLLDRQLDTLAANGVEQAVVVTGFRDELVEEALAKRSGGPGVRTIYNPFYKVADNLGSLFLARDELAGDCLVWNGDTLVADSLMRRVIANTQDGICVTIDRKDGYDEDDMKVVVADDGQLEAIGKRIAKGVNGESIGLLAFRGDGAERFREAIEGDIRTPKAPRSGTCASSTTSPSGRRCGRSTSAARSGGRSIFPRTSSGRASWSPAGTRREKPLNLPAEGSG